MAKYGISIYILILFNCGILFAVDPPELLKRAYVNMEALSSNCAVVSHLEYARVSPVPAENVGRSERRQALIFNDASSGRNRLELFSTRFMARLQVKDSPFDGVPETLEVYDIVARSSDDWWYRRQRGLGNPVLRRIETDKLANDEAKDVLNHLSLSRFELAAMPLLNFGHLLKSEVNFERSKAHFNPLNKHHFNFHSTEHSSSDGVTTGLWTNSDGSGLFRIQFTAASDWLPTVFEYYARDPNVLFSEGASKGLLTYRTATKWAKTTSNVKKFCPKSILIETFETGDNVYQTVAIESEWKIDLKRGDFTEECIVQPDGDNALGDLFRELNDSLEVIRKKQAVSSSIKKK